jgi:8-amino-7-oxononanoate synthase
LIPPFQGDLKPPAMRVVVDFHNSTKATCLVHTVLSCLFLFHPIHHILFFGNQPSSVGYILSPTHFSHRPVDNRGRLGYRRAMLQLKQELNALEEAGLYRRMASLASETGPRATIDGRQVLLLASNDYLGLAAHPRMKARAQAAAAQWGTGAGTSRLISGNNVLFDELEAALARFKDTEAALVFNTGYMANAGLLHALAGPDDAIFSDELNHASIIDGCRLSRARVEVYPHRDTQALEQRLEKCGRDRRRIIITDGVFSMDGDLAPLPELGELAERYDATLIVDDAHGTGCLGQTGRGTLQHFGLAGSPDIIVMATLGKALGSFGAFVAGSLDLRHYLINRARSFIFTTALPPLVVASALEALRILDDEPWLRQRLAENAGFMREGLRAQGFNTLDSSTQIIPVLIGEPEKAVVMAHRLFEKGIFIQAIRPPAVPQGSSRLRITVMATHIRQDLAWALEVLCKTGKEMGII